MIHNTHAEEIAEGDSVYFGRYEQDDSIESREPIEWIVLEVKDDKALLISKRGLDYVSFAEDANDSWVSCSLRSWLNEDFYNLAFLEEEQSAIVQTRVPNDSSQGKEEWKPESLPETKDKIFLLSYQEIMNYFANESSRQALDTPYAASKGDVFRIVTNVAIKEAGWWSRSPGESNGERCFVETDGTIRSKSDTEKSTVRPVLWLDLSKDRSSFTYERYNAALELQKDGKYKEAAEIFESLTDYEQSVDNAVECKYLQAEQAVGDSDYELAIDLYTELNGYKDSNKLGRKARYDYAVMVQESGDFEKALSLFENAGQYKDSMQRLRDCCAQLGIQIFFFSVDAVNTGLDNGYSKADEIEGDDRHFGWRLGRFFMNGFTRVSEGTSNNPIFVKTVGDSVTLWFDLEQSINKLNGNKDLSVSEDSNGYDQYFGIKKTNFGRGTLIIRHTDYQNAKSDPVIYTDYLLAKGTSGADTKVILNEEGDYEVSLDYQLQDDDILHINRKYGNYKIRFNFSIRNGNCMVYPFDVVTKNELQNTAITENGFYLDLARSRYLNIDVKRSVIIPGPNGDMIEDERFNRPAKDGDQYTDEGIYTISVSNLYTGESTVKTIFVGSDELLQEYIKNGFSVDRLG